MATAEAPSVVYKTFTRHRGDTGQLEPGQYKRVLDVNGGLRHTAIIRCTCCRKTFSLAPPHQILAEGDVHGTVQCPHDGCDGQWMVVRLLEWQKL